MVAPMTTDPDLVITGPTIATLPQPSAAEMLSGVWGIPVSCLQVTIERGRTVRKAVNSPQLLGWCA